MSTTNEIKATFVGLYGNIAGVFKQNRELEGKNKALIEKITELEADKQKLTADKAALKSKVRFKREQLSSNSAWSLTTVTQKTKGIKRKGFSDGNVCDWHCDICRLGYFNPGSLATHLNNKHRDDMMFKAKTCGDEVVAHFKKAKK